MSAVEHNDLATRLADARGSHRLIDSKPFDAIASLEDAYKIQAMAVSAYPSKQIGWKVGATNEGTQKLFGCNAPFFGPMFEQDVMPPDSELSLRDGVLGGEGEFAFVCGSDFPLTKNLSAEQLPALIKSCHIAVEIVGRRTVGKGLPGLNSTVADFGGHVAFIPGPAIESWESIDMASVEVKANTNGEQTNSGSGAAVLNHPFNSLLWLHQELMQSGNSLKAGDWVSTGTCLGLIAAVVGSVDIEFNGCGRMGYTFI